MQALILATWSSEDSRVLPGPRPSPWPMLALVCADSGGSAHCSPTFLLPSNRWQCFPAVSHHVGGWGAKLPCGVWEPQAHARAECCHVGVGVYIRVYN